MMLPLQVMIKFSMRFEEFTRQNWGRGRMNESSGQGKVAGTEIWWSEGACCV